MERILFTLLRLGLGLKSSEKEYEELLALPIAQWKAAMTLAERQGMAAIVFDGVQRLYDTYGKEICAAKNQYAEWIQWVFTCTGVMSQYEQRCLAQRAAIAELAGIWAKEGIKMMVFKGQANASFYPKPEHRATGDIDCYLFGQAEQGDAVLSKLGVKIDKHWYRHSKISFKGEIIENHRVMGHTRGSKKKKDMEEELKRMAHERVEGLEMKDEGLGCALIPSAQFNACFLTYHGLHHFLSEGLRMKQILDWAMFLQKEQDKVDWETYWDFCKRYKLDRFAEVMMCIATEFLGIKTNTNLTDNGHTDTTDIKPLAEKVMQSTLYDDNYLFNSSRSDWMVRWLLVKNMFTRNYWKYRDVAQESVLRHLWQNATGYLFDKD